MLIIYLLIKGKFDDVFSISDIEILVYFGHSWNYMDIQKSQKYYQNATNIVLGMI